MEFAFLVSAEKELRISTFPGVLMRTRPSPMVGLAKLQYSLAHFPTFHGDGTWRSSGAVLSSDAETIAADMADQRVMERMIVYVELGHISMIHEVGDRDTYDDSLQRPGKGEVTEIVSRASS